MIQPRRIPSDPPETHDRPIEHCYWVVPTRLLAGEYPRNQDEPSSREKLEALINAGVTAFIDLTETDEGLHPYIHLLEAHRGQQVSHQRFSIRDVSVPHSSETTVAILDAIDHQLEQGRKVYLHCWGGVGRTGLVVGCWLVRHGLEGEAALEHLRELWQENPKSARRKTPETAEQERYILSWREPR